jgi:hypothetical protein
MTCFLSTILRLSFQRTVPRSKKVRFGFFDNWRRFFLNPRRESSFE